MEFDDLTHCSVCREIYRDPHKLRCDHSFCRACVNQLRFHDSVTCPLCTKRTMLQDVKADFRLVAFQERFASQAQQLTAASAERSRSPPWYQAAETETTCERCRRDEGCCYRAAGNLWLCGTCMRTYKQASAHAETSSSDVVQAAMTKSSQSLTNANSSSRNFRLRRKLCTRLKTVPGNGVGR